MKRFCFLLAIALGLCLVSAENKDPVPVDHLPNAISAPRVVTLTVTPVQILTNNASRTAGRVLVRTVQNTGTTAFVYTIDTNTVSTSVYHGVIPGGTDALDGKGGQLNLSAVPGDVWARSVSGTTTIAIVELTQ